jgi:hypothetical protein
MQRECMQVTLAIVLSRKERHGIVDQPVELLVGQAAPAYRGCEVTMTGDEPRHHDHSSRIDGAFGFNRAFRLAFPESGDATVVIYRDIANVGQRVRAAHRDDVRIAHQEFVLARCMTEGCNAHRTDQQHHSHHHHVPVHCARARRECFGDSHR